MNPPHDYRYVYMVQVRPEEQEDDPWTTAVGPDTQTAYHMILSALYHALKMHVEANNPYRWDEDDEYDDNDSHAEWDEVWRVPLDVAYKHVQSKAPLTWNMLDDVLAAIYQAVMNESSEGEETPFPCDRMYLDGPHLVQAALTLVPLLTDSPATAPVVEAVPDPALDALAREAGVQI